MNLKQIIKDVHKNAENHGWWVEYEKIMKQHEWTQAYNDGVDKNFIKLCKFWESIKLNWIAAKLALIHSEVAELEEAKTDENFAEELADICIRVFDLIGGLEIDIEKMIFYNTWCIHPDRSINWHVSQALEFLRKDKVFLFENALFSVILKCQFKARDYGVNLDQAINKKMEYNKSRPYKHGIRL